MGKRSFLAVFYIFFFTTWCGNIFSTNSEKYSSRLPLVSPTLTVTITPPDTIDPNPRYCTGIPYHFNGNANPGPILTWSWTCSPSTGVIIANPQNNGTDITFTNMGTYTLSVTAMNTSGIMGTQTYSINAPGVLQTPVVYSSPSAPTVCNGGTGTIMYAFATPTTSPTSYTWSPQTSVTNLDANGDSVNINPSVLNPSNLPEVFTYSLVGLQNGCYSAPAIITVTVTAPPTPKYVATPSVICAGLESQLSVNGLPSNTSYTWTAMNNTEGLGGNSGSFVQATPIYHGGVDTTFLYNVSFAVPGCPPYQPYNMQLHVIPTPVITIVPDTFANCNKMGDTLKVTSVYPATGVGIVWTYTTGAVVPPLASDTNTAFVKPTKATKYYVTPTLYDYNYFPVKQCSAKKDSVIVLIGDTTNAGIGYTYEIVCAGQKDTLVAYPQNGQLNNSYHYSWSPPLSVLYSSASGDTVVVSPQTSPTTTYTLNVSGICVKKKQAEIIIAVNHCNTPVVSFTASQYVICAGRQHCITYTDLTQANSVKPLFYTWVFPEGTITNAGGGQVFGGDTIYYAAVDSINIKPIRVCYPVNSSLNSHGYYPITEYVANGLGQTGQYKDSIKVNPGPQANAGNNVTIDLGTSVTLSSGASTAGTNIISYNWAPSGDSLSCTSCQNPVATPSTTTEYTLVIIDQTGCSDSANVTIFVDIVCKPIFIATAFSPNGDGVNDLLHVKSNCELSNFVFRIFDRWGEKVFESSDPNQGWDGTFRNKPVDTGVFIYTVDGFLSSGVEVKKKGNVTLLR